MRNVKITYITHSGFLVETASAAFLFDYYKGTMPQIKSEKPLVVFVSHVHHDHYNPAIWELCKEHPKTTYVLSYDIPLDSLGSSDRGSETSAAPSKNSAVFDAGKKILLKNRSNTADVFSLLPDKTVSVELEPAKKLHIETFASTDEGLAFFIEYDGLSIYHAGDLHLWLWEENGSAYMKAMKKQFFDATRNLAGRHVDIAFLLLDGRLGNRTFDGMDAYLELMDIGLAFPMHMWEDYSLTDKYLSQRRSLHGANALQKISCEGQTFDLKTEN